jgi:hypothetical protein
MKRQLIGLVAVATLALTGCGQGGGKPAPGPTAAPSTTGATSTTAVNDSAAVDYHPVIVPADFSTRITNPYFPLPPGTTYVFDGIRDGLPQRTEMTVTKETKMIMGVSTVVVRDVVTSNGALVEKTTDWYAQKRNGDVWYFGEATAEYENGKVTSTKGSWEAGVDNAQPGIIMLGSPRPGAGYRQEYRPGEALDTAKVQAVGEKVTVPAGTYSKVVVTNDTNPLAPDRIDKKWYGPGVGLVKVLRERTGHHEEARLVKIVKA